MAEQIVCRRVFVCDAPAGQLRRHRICHADHGDNPRILQLHVVGLRVSAGRHCLRFCYVQQRKGCTGGKAFRRF